MGMDKKLSKARFEGATLAGMAFMKCSHALDALPDWVGWAKDHIKIHWRKLGFELVIYFDDQPRVAVGALSGSNPDLNQQAALEEAAREVMNTIFKGAKLEESRGPKPI